ncbi:hypothetical protein ADUPG1_011834 [Aduncisulcus paluster]|uniref:Uncharacterized protein n=1 Tax=Aduncisulcus paluster TaxID=2918883 RepID=A0ABQ5K0M0_9EUKA|nr:hypothetical protein ADUPG1_011834 [Aduncisulcus paluster]
MKPEIQAKQVQRWEQTLRPEDRMNLNSFKSTYSRTSSRSLPKQEKSVTISEPKASPQRISTPPVRTMKQTRDVEYGPNPSPLIAGYMKRMAVKHAKEVVSPPSRRRVKTTSSVPRRTRFWDQPVNFVGPQYDSSLKATSGVEWTHEFTKTSYDRHFQPGSTSRVDEPAIYRHFLYDTKSVTVPQTMDMKGDLLDKKERTMRELSVEDAVLLRKGILPEEEVSIDGSKVKVGTDEKSQSKRLCDIVLKPRYRHLQVDGRTHYRSQFTGDVSTLLKEMNPEESGSTKSLATIYAERLYRKPPPFSLDAALWKKSALTTQNERAHRASANVSLQTLRKKATTHLTDVEFAGAKVIFKDPTISLDEVQKFVDKMESHERQKFKSLAREAASVSGR